MSDLNKRIDILKQAGQISEDSVLLAQKIINYFSQDVLIELTEENGSMLITHIVMANERIKKNDPVEKLDQMIIQQLKNDNQYQKASQITKDIAEFFGTNFVETERDYITMHVLNLVKGVK